MAKQITNINIGEVRKVPYDQSKIYKITEQSAEWQGVPFRDKYQLSSFVRRAYDGNYEIGDINGIYTSATTQITYNPLIADKLILGGDVLYKISPLEFTFYSPIITNAWIYESMQMAISGNSIIGRYKRRELNSNGEPQELSVFEHTWSIDDTNFPNGIDTSVGVLWCIMSFVGNASNRRSDWYYYSKSNIDDITPLYGLSAKAKAYIKKYIPNGVVTYKRGQGSNSVFYYKTLNGDFDIMPVTMRSPIFDNAYDCNLYPCISEDEANACLCANACWTTAQRNYFN